MQETDLPATNAFKGKHRQHSAMCVCVYVFVCVSILSQFQIRNIFAHINNKNLIRLPSPSF